ncbi:MAG: NAD-glutamate dehydrogenase, partial [Gemmatimonadetes bacterium]|nr:NAD-glutamate dehydrogenase [Gemmatimonadota bacterium]
MSEQTSTSARAVTVDELCEHLSALRRPDGDALCRFARLFFAKVPRQLLEERGTAQLAALTLGAWEFLRGARPDQVNVQVVDPDDEGWSAPVTVIRAEVGDRPFIVDTVREYLAGEGLHIHQYVYPVIPVRRGPAGDIVAVGDEAGEGAPLEALTHCEVVRVTDPTQRTAVADGIRQRLADVVDATSDFPAMTRVLEHEARVVEEYASRFPDRAEEFAEQAEFLRWLGRGNFVFLGYREYVIEGDGDAATVALRPGSGLGILRDPSSSAYARPVPVADLAEGLRQRLLDGPTLVVDKSNAQSTVHRRGRMDYVGVKVLDEAGRVRGERRFLGLFTTQAYGSSVTDIPLLRRKLQRLLGASGSRPGGHDYKETVSIVDALPKDELFEATEEQLRDQVQASLAALFTEGVRVVVRASPVRDEASVLVILPGGRFSAEVRRAVGEGLAARFGGQVLNHYLRMAAGDQARIHYYLTTAPG